MMRYSSLLLMPFLFGSALPAAGEQTFVADTVSYSRDIAPILQRNCVACHRAKQAEGGLSLETPKALLEGGDSGELLVAKQSETSLLYVRASGAEEPLMPPEDNTVGAKRLTENELGLLKAWIDDGAKIDGQAASSTFDWQPIPDSVRSTFSLAVSPDDRTVAVGHANRVELLDSKTGAVMGVLRDEGLPQTGAADVDVVQAIAFSPLGDRLATGGFRTVRIWKRQPNVAIVPRALKFAVGKVSLSPDRSALAVVNAIGDVDVWDLASDERRYRIPSSGIVTDMDWRRQDDFVIGYADGSLHVCNAGDGSTIGQLELDQSIAEVAQGADGRFIASLGTDGHVRLFDKQRLKQLQTLVAIDDATTILFVTPNNLAIGTATGAAVMIDLASDRLIHRLDHGAAIGALATDTLSKTLATGASDGRTKLWNVGDGKLLHTLIGGLETQLQLKTLDQDVNRVQSGVTQLEKKTEELKKQLEKEESALAKVTETREKASKELIEKRQQRDASAGLIVATEQKIAAAKLRVEQSNQSALQAEQLVATSNTQVQKINAELLPLEKQSALAVSELQAAQVKVTEAMHFLEVARRSAEAAAMQLTDKKKSLVDQQKKATEAVASLATSKKAAADATASIDLENTLLAKQRETLAAAEKETEKKQSDLAEREQAFVTATKTRDQAAGELPIHQDAIRQRRNRLSNLKSRLISLSQSRDRSAAVASIVFAQKDNLLAIVDVAGAIRTFDSAVGTPIDRFGSTADLPGQSSSQEAFFLDNQRLVAAHRSGQSRVIPVDRSWILERTIGGLESDLITDRVTALDFRGDGASLAIGSGAPSRDGQVLIVATSSGDVLRRFEEVHSDSVLCVRFSPDDRILATASADKTIRLLDVQTQQVVGSLDGHTHHVLSVSWKRDGRLIASGSADGTIKTWDVDSGQRKRTIEGFPEEVTATQFLGDSSRVVSCCADGQVRVHETNNGGLVGAASAAGDFLFTLGVTADGERILAAGQNGTVTIWEANGLKSLGAWK